MFTFLKKYLKLSVDSIKKINKKYIYVFIVFLVLSILSLFFNKKTIFYKNNLIKRQGYGSIDKKYNINVDIGNVVKNENIEFVVNSKRYKEEELLKIFEYAFDDCVIKVLGNNKDFNHIEDNLIFFDTYKDGISVIWKFRLLDDQNIEKCKKYYNLIESNGKINFDIIDDEYIEGSIEFYLKGYVDNKDRPIKSNTYSVPVVILSKEKSEKNLLIEKLLYTIHENNQNTINSEYIQLPKNIDNYSVNYNEKVDISFLYILILGFIIIFLLKIKEKYDVKEKENKRKKLLLLTYPKLINKLLIYVSSGLTIRNGISRIGMDYKDRLNKGIEKENIVFEKIYEAKINLDNGVIEKKVYEKLSKEIDDKKYSRFFNILIQNINNGNKDFRDILSLEASDSLIEKKNNAKKLGEEATTKLIIPLMLDLVIVMLVIIIPAFMGI